MNKDLDKFCLQFEAEMEHKFYEMIKDTLCTNGFTSYLAISLQTREKLEQLFTGTSLKT